MGGVADSHVGRCPAEAHEELQCFLREGHDGRHRAYHAESQAEYSWDDDWYEWLDSSSPQT